MPGSSGEKPYSIVTGGNKGIGKETVRGLMQKGYHVVIAARDTTACETAKQDLDSANLPGTCECQKLDLEDPQSIRSFADTQKKELQKRKAKLKVLVNNAGVMGVGHTPSGFDRHMLCNHLGPFLLTCLLEDNLGPQSRIVNLSSRAHYQGSLTFDDKGDWVQRPGRSWFWRYSDSKLANVVFTSELQKRLADKKVVSVSASPGLVASNIFVSVPWPISAVLPPLIRLIGKTTQQGAETSVYAATSPEVTGTKEQLFLHDCKPMTPLAVSHDPKLGQQLWDWSQKFVDQWQ